MKKFLMLLMVLSIATTAFAVVDQDADMMGFYFDLSADTPCLDGVAPFSTLDLHLILTRPTTDMLYGFEAGHTVVGNGMVLSAEFAAIQYITPVTLDNIITSYGEPYPTSEATLLVTFSVLYTDTASGALEFYLHGSEPSSIDPLYPVIVLADGILQSIGLSAETGPTAQINGGCSVVATDNVSFDSVKSLYR